MPQQIEVPEEVKAFFDHAGDEHIQLSPARTPTYTYICLKL